MTLFSRALDENFAPVNEDEPENFADEKMQSSSNSVAENLVCPAKTTDLKSAREAKIVLEKSAVLSNVAPKKETRPPSFSAERSKSH